jgi:integrase
MGFDPEKADDRMVVAFVRVLVLRRRLSASSVLSALSAIGHHFRFAATNPVVSARVAMARRAAKKTAPASKPKRPLTTDLLAQISTKLDLAPGAKGYLQRLRDWAMVLLAYRSFLRRSELVALRLSDVQFTEFKSTDPDAVGWPAAMLDQQLIVLRVASSKTRPTARRLDATSDAGVTVIVGPHSDRRLCPVRWCKSAFSAIAAAGKSSEWFFPNLTDNSKPLAGATVGHAVKRFVALIGLDPKDFAAHSTRRGAATDAFKQRIDAALVKRMGRWSSDAVYLYVDNAVGEMLRFNEVMGRVGHSPSLSSDRTARSASAASAAADVDGGSDSDSGNELTVD